MNPIEKLNNDRHVARTHDDPNADICFLALSEYHQPSVRTLVLRDVNESGLTLFVNSTSPKWRISQANNLAELLVWLSSIQRQYRVRGELSVLPDEQIARNWPRRPAGSKYLDHSYGTFADQSSPIKDRQALVDHVAALREQTPEDDLKTPATAKGLLLVPSSIETLDLNRADRIHERKLFTREGETWTETPLMP